MKTATNFADSDYDTNKEQPFLEEDKFDYSGQKHRHERQ